MIICFVCVELLLFCEISFYHIQQKFNILLSKVFGDVLFLCLSLKSLVKDTLHAKERDIRIQWSKVEKLKMKRHNKC